MDKEVIRRIKAECDDLGLQVSEYSGRMLSVTGEVFKSPGFQNRVTITLLEHSVEVKLDVYPDGKLNKRGRLVATDIYTIQCLLAMVAQLPTSFKEAYLEFMQREHFRRMLSRGRQ